MIFSFIYKLYVRIYLEYCLYHLIMQIYMLYAIHILSNTFWQGRNDFAVHVITREMNILPWEEAYLCLTSTQLTDQLRAKYCEVIIGKCIIRDKLHTVRVYFQQLNKVQRKPIWQSGMVNLVTLATLGTHDIGRRQTEPKNKKTSKERKNTKKNTQKIKR